MRRSAMFALVLVCVAAVSAAASSGGRMVEKAYQPVEVGAGGARSSNGVTFRPRAAERFVEVTIEDESGTTVPARLTQDLDGDRDYEVEVDFCGATDGPVEIQPGHPVTVWMQIGWCEGPATPNDAGAHTQGTMTAKFSR